MRPAAPAGFVSDCCIAQNHPGRLAPPRVTLQTVDSVCHAEGGVSSYFAPRLLLPPPLQLIKELKAFQSFSTHMKSVHEKILHAHAFVRSQKSDNDDDNSSSLPSIPNVDDVESALANFGFFEETPLVVVNPPTTAEVKKFGSSMGDDGAGNGAASIQGQRSDFARLLEDSLNNNSNNNTNNHNTSKRGDVDREHQLLPTYPDASQMIGTASEVRRKAAEAFIERCKQLWQMLTAMNNPNNTEIPDHVSKNVAAFGDNCSSSVSSSFAAGRIQLLKQPLVFSLQVAMCAQDIACSPTHVGFSWDLLGGAAKDFHASNTVNTSKNLRVQLRDVFPSEVEARRQVEVAVLIHKILVAMCLPIKDVVDVRVEPSDIAVLAYFARPRSDGGDGTRLLELWPGGPLGLFPIASFASFVPIKEAANAVIDLVGFSRPEDGNDPVLRIRCSSIVDATTLLQQQQEMVSSSSSSLLMSNEVQQNHVHRQQQELRIWKRPISSTIPENVVAAKEQAKQKDPRMAIARFMQGIRGGSSKEQGGVIDSEKRKAALEMALRLAGQQ